MLDNSNQFQGRAVRNRVEGGETNAADVETGVEDGERQKGRAGLLVLNKFQHLPNDPIKLLWFLCFSPRFPGYCVYC